MTYIATFREASRDIHDIIGVTVTSHISTASSGCRFCNTDDAVRAGGSVGQHRDVKWRRTESN